MTSIKAQKKPVLTLDSAIVQDNVPTEVFPKLFIGSIHAACNEDALFERRITHILNSSRFPPMYPSIFSYLSIDLRDKEDSSILSCIPPSNIFIGAGVDSGGVLVHCFGGRSRSAALIVAYLMSSYNWSYDEVVDRLKLARPVISINKGFEAQLKAYYDAKFDIYLAQQILLRKRAKNLQSVRFSDGSLRGRSAAHKGLPSEPPSSGSKRSFGDLDTSMVVDTNTDALDTVESQEPAQSKISELLMIKTSASTLADSKSSPSPSKMKSSKVKGAAHFLKPRSPSCILSKPGSSIIRVLPPLRGLDRGFCCNQCQTILFSLANVLRLDESTLSVTSSTDSKSESVTIKAIDISESIDEDETAPVNLVTFPKEPQPVNGLSFSTAARAAQTPRGTRPKSFEFEIPSCKSIQSNASVSLQPSACELDDKMDEEEEMNGQRLVLERVMLIASVASEPMTKDSSAASKPDNSRWLAPGNLVLDSSGLGGASDEMVVKMTVADNSAFDLGFGSDDHFIMEHLDWMNTAIMSGDSESGSILCPECSSVLGEWTWSPDPWYSRNGLIAPLIRVRKDVVQHTDLPFDHSFCDSSNSSLPTGIPILPSKV